MRKVRVKLIDYKNIIYDLVYICICYIFLFFEIIIRMISKLLFIIFD